MPEPQWRYRKFHWSAGEQTRCHPEAPFRGFDIWLSLLERPDIGASKCIAIANAVRRGNNEARTPGQLRATRLKGSGGYAGDRSASCWIRWRSALDSCITCSRTASDTCASAPAASLTAPCSTARESTSIL